MSCVEQALLFPCAGEILPAIIAWPYDPLVVKGQGGNEANDARGARTNGGDRSGSVPCAARPPSCGVLIVVGGPQYRVGSHRQFLLLARRLAAAGYPVMRFDYRGMGDASGAMPGFEAVSNDVGAAIDAFRSAAPGLRKIVLWGLCDAASAALLYVQASADERVAGMVLLNPWVRSETSLAQTHLKHYYGQRLLQKEFWWKLCTGRMELLKSVRDLLRTAVLARRPGAAEAGTTVNASFQERMAGGGREFSGKILLILSSEDYTAKEFLEYAASSSGWSGLLDAPKVSRLDLADADHTFSSLTWRRSVEEATLAWLDALNGAHT